MGQCRGGILTVSCQVMKCVNTIAHRNNLADLSLDAKDEFGYHCLCYRLGVVTQTNEDGANGEAH
jgi:hypothetical protein